MFTLPETDGINPEIKNLYDALGQIVNDLGFQKYFYTYHHFSCNENEISAQIPDYDTAVDIHKKAQRFTFFNLGREVYEDAGHLTGKGAIHFNIILNDIVFKVLLYSFPVDKESFLNPVPVKVTTYEPAKTEVLIVE